MTTIHLSKHSAKRLPTKNHRQPNYGFTNRNETDFNKEISRIVDVRAIMKSTSEQRLMKRDVGERQDRIVALGDVIARNRQWREQKKQRQNQQQATEQPKSQQTTIKQPSNTCFPTPQKPRIAVPKHLPHRIDNLTCELRPIKNITNSNFTTRRSKQLNKLKSLSDLHSTKLLQTEQ